MAFPPLCAVKKRLEDAERHGQVEAVVLLGRAGRRLGPRHALEPTLHVDTELWLIVGCGAVGALRADGEAVADVANASDLMADIVPAARSERATVEEREGHALPIDGRTRDHVDFVEALALDAEDECEIGRHRLAVRRDDRGLGAEAEGRLYGLAARGHRGQIQLAIADATDRLSRHRDDLLDHADALLARAPGALRVGGAGAVDGLGSGGRRILLQRPRLRGAASAEEKGGEDRKGLTNFFVHQRTPINFQFMVLGTAVYSTISSI